MEFPKQNIKDYVQQLADQHGIVYVENDLDRFGLKIAELSDAEVVPDATRNLLIRLTQHNIITTKEMVDLLDLHLREIGMVGKN